MKTKTKDFASAIPRRASDAKFVSKGEFSLRTVDLFAGCGGLTLGLHAAGHQLLFAVEKDPMAFETFQTNFFSPGAAYPVRNRWPDWLEIRNHDIRELLEGPDSKKRLLQMRGSIDLICGGPPCQGFSVGGLRDGKDARNQMPWKYIEFVGLLRPRFVLLENVEGILRAFQAKPGDVKGAIVDWIKTQLEDIGYDVSFRIVDSSEFGVPQIRRRVFFFGVNRIYCKQNAVQASDFFAVLNGIRKDFLNSHSLPLDRPVTVSEAINDLDGRKVVPCPDSPKFTSGTYSEQRSEYSRLMRRGIADNCIPNSHRFSKHTDKILAFYRAVHAAKQFGRLPKSFLLQHGTKKDKKVLLDPAEPASTITTHPDEFIHFRTPRNITVREMARIQSFPDDFVFKGRYTINGERRRLDVARCSQVGNAVPPLLAEAIGWALHEFQRLGQNECSRKAFKAQMAALIAEDHEEMPLFAERR